MRDINFQIRQGFYNALSAITISNNYQSISGFTSSGNTRVISVYDYFAPAKENDYILLAEQTCDVSKMPNCFIYNCTILIDITTKFLNSSISRKPVDLIGDAVLNALTENSINATLNTFKLSLNNLQLDSMLNRSDQFDTYKDIRKLYRLSFTVNSF